MRGGLCPAPTKILTKFALIKRYDWSTRPNRKYPADDQLLDSRHFLIANFICGNTLRHYWLSHRFIKRYSAFELVLDGLITRLGKCLLRVERSTNIYSWNYLAFRAKGSSIGKQHVFYENFSISSWIRLTREIHIETSWDSENISIRQVFFDHNCSEKAFALKRSKQKRFFSKKAFQKPQHIS